MKLMVIMWYIVKVNAFLMIVYMCTKNEQLTNDYLMVHSKNNKYTSITKSFDVCLIDQYRQRI